MEPNFGRNDVVIVAPTGTNNGNGIPKRPFLGVVIDLRANNMLWLKVIPEEVHSGVSYPSDGILPISLDNEHPILVARGRRNGRPQDVVEAAKKNSKEIMRILRGLLQTTNPGPTR